MKVIEISDELKEQTMNVDSVAQVISVMQEICDDLRGPKTAEDQ